MKRYIKLLLSLTLAGFMSTVMADVAPDEMVKSIAHDVLETIKNDKDIQAGDEKRVSEVAEEKILPNFNFDRVSRMVLGKNWSSATKEQQMAFQNEFKDLLLHTYASALTKYRGQTINFKPLRAQPGAKEVTVKSEIVQPGGQPIAVDYSLEKGANGWKVYDIIIEGVSLVTNYRSQFSNEVRQNGMDGLIQKLVTKNQQAGSSKTSAN